MARLSRYTQLIFGSGASANQISKFGSLAAGGPLRYSGATVTPTLIQGLSNYLTGWFGAVMGGNSPAIEDMNAVCYLFAFQLAYLMQTGVPEYDAGTTYYSGCLCSSSGIIYVSKTDNNVGNALTSTTNWKVYGGGFRTVTANDTATSADDLVRVDAASGNQTETLPAVATTPLGKKITVKKVDSGTNTVTVQGNAAELLDFENTYVMEAPGESVTVQNNGTSWDII